MKIRYFVQIDDPETHIVKVTLKGEIPSASSQLTFYLPSWSPGSYLMREYARNVRTFRAYAENGEPFYFEQVDKGAWRIDVEASEFKKTPKSFEVNYEIFCHELTVRTSHVDYSHAFLHGPSYLMGVFEQDLDDIQIQFKFPGLWSKLHTTLEDVSKKREEFVYKADSFDDLIDTPVEIGCHESDGFMHDGKEHHLVWYGDQYPHDNDLKADIKKIVETVSSHFEDIPYERYMFITHFSKDLYGGLEHKNSTALHFDGRKLGDRKSYLSWLGLVAHEYFHTWNVKRIRPKELGPFDYRNENYTRMHWLTEGLTSFMDDLLVLRSGLCSLEEYLELQKVNLSRYFDIPGRKFHSLEDSSFNAWVKLYRPDANHNNSSISYYLKGGLVFSVLNSLLKEDGSSVNDLLRALYKRYKENSEVGVTKEEVLSMIESISSPKVSDEFESMISTTKEIDFESMYKKWGMSFVWSEKETPYLGCTFQFDGERAIIKTVTLDSPAYKAGLNAGDEILAINENRYLKTDAMEITKILKPETLYSFRISRLHRIYTIDVQVGKSPKTLEKIEVVNEAKAKELLL
jgi:predicted metalloprotease with PDZ domain